MTNLSSIQFSQILSCCAQAESGTHLIFEQFEANVPVQYETGVDHMSTFLKSVFSRKRNATEIDTTALAQAALVARAAHVMRAQEPNTGH